MRGWPCLQEAAWPRAARPRICTKIVGLMRNGTLTPQRISRGRFDFSGAVDSRHQHLSAGRFRAPHQIVGDGVIVVRQSGRAETRTRPAQSLRSPRSKRLPVSPGCRECCGAALRAPASVRPWATSGRPTPWVRCRKARHMCGRTILPRLRRPWSPRNSAAISPPRRRTRRCGGDRPRRWRRRPRSRRRTAARASARGGAGIRWWGSAGAGARSWRRRSSALSREARPQSLSSDPLRFPSCPPCGSRPLTGSQNTTNGAKHDSGLGVPPLPKPPINPYIQLRSPQPQNAHA